MSLLPLNRVVFGAVVLAVLVIGTLFFRYFTTVRATHAAARTETHLAARDVAAVARDEARCKSDVAAAFLAGRQYEASFVHDSLLHHVNLAPHFSGPVRLPVAPPRE